MCDFLKCVCERLHASGHFKREKNPKRQSASLRTCACARQRETIGDIERWREFCQWLPYGAALPCPCATHTNGSHHSCLLLSGNTLRHTCIQLKFSKPTVRRYSLPGRPDQTQGAVLASGYQRAELIPVHKADVYQQHACEKRARCFAENAHSVCVWNSFRAHTEFTGLNAHGHRANLVFIRRRPGKRRPGTETLHCGTRSTSVHPMIAKSVCKRVVLVSA